MVRINLLPPEDRGKGAETEEVGGGGFNPLDPQILGPLALLIILGAAIFVMYSNLNGQKADMQAQIEEAKAELKKLKKVEQEVNNLENTRKMIAERVKEIERLDQNRHYWAQVLDNLSRSLPEQVWLTDISDRSAAGRPSLSLRGEAFSNIRIAEFMDRLKNSDIVEDASKIELVYSTVGKVKKTLVGNYQLYKFDMLVELIPSEKLKSKIPEKDQM